MTQSSKNKNILCIDTSSNQEVIIGIEKDRNKEEIKKVLESHRDQVVLPLILQILQTHGLHLADLNEIRVHTGPGSFTGLRVGVAVANALGYALNIPVNGLQAPVEPTYS